ncbi:hypothetical protein FBR01_20330, partial [Anaerolineae bacterium CFX8]|nr:hypothetical protein [Anaerolineae bacterium CFX8]
MLPLPNRPRALAILLAALLLLIAASRIPRLHEPQMNQDEIWSVWQTLGSPAQIIRWTPYDWPPLYYLALGTWRGLAHSERRCRPAARRVARTRRVVHQRPEQRQRWRTP